jgi:hypothetical protein
VRRDQRVRWLWSANPRLGRAAGDRYERGVARDVRLGIFTEELFGTGNDVDDRAAGAKVPSDELRLVRLPLYDHRRVVDRVLSDLRLHP